MISLDGPKLDGANDIHDIIIECKRLFESLAERVKLDHGEKDVKTEKGEQEDEQMAFGDRTGSSKLSTDEMESRFNLWIDDSGALAADVSRSLDTRLSARRNIKEMVTDLLQMLARNLKYLHKGDSANPDVPRGSSGNNSDTDELEGEARHAIQYALDELHFMASAIRKSEECSQKHSLSSSFHQNYDSYLKEQACRRVRQYFRDAPRSLCYQLGASLAIRCIKLLRRVWHEEKLSTRRNPDESKHHTDEDTEPYVCLSEDCTSPMLFFVNMNDWMNHMEMFHSNQWNHKIHMNTWYCNIGHKPTIQFDDHESFVRHMKDPANHEGREPPTDRQLETLSRNKQKFLFRDEYRCPFCECVPSALEPVILNSSPDEIRRQLYEHIAAHIKDLVIKSIPTLDEVESTQFEIDNEDQTWLRGDNSWHRA
ncbi:hypothetical protein N5P37_007115 [Trichoderma harzianum]|uniref:C2H2-type domain-containing protein n=1 Tax=Trichoderma harzianum CBS 226.95 TaxID=983964 RepID=A0A2T4AK31_TRIHA|nr:hypothetical protein M431DRAFT_2561 [Trichoderma harzianum CBS 226.95]KAK0760036.1 hypothetical protein N5P37_007115 [Trichoderma harzianum]PKK46001.1 hypothetical protein CI102_8203 [Trichoderma harzianum]PTB57435.1 hypothetical protein M431DRAFT_2561 [Trichoderma harzianum CBS 226.95]